MKPMKYSILSLAAATLLTTSMFSVNTTPVKAAESSVVEPQMQVQYMPFQVYKHADLQETSSMGRSMDLVSKLQVENGKTYAYVTIKSASIWNSFKTDVHGEMKEVETISTNEVENTRLVKFEVSSTSQAIRADIEIQAGPTKMQHTTYLQFQQDATSLRSFQVWNEQKDAISSGVTRSVETPAQIVQVGDKTYAYITLKSAQYWKGVKSLVGDVLTEATVVEENVAANTRVVRIEIPSLDEVVKTESHIQAGNYDATYTTYFDFNHVIENGQFQFVKDQAFQVWDEAKEKASTMANYMGTPARLVEKDGKQYAEVTLKSASIWKGFQTEVAGQLVDVTTVKEDKTADTKVVRFEVPSINQLIKAKTHIQMGNYEGTYTTYFDFNHIIDSIVKPPVVVDPNKVISTTKYNYVLKNKTKKATSKANAYMTKPMKVEKTQAGKYYATVTLKNAAMWKSVKAEVNGKKVAVKTIATNSKKKTRTVRFQVKSPTATTKLHFTLQTASKKLAGTYTTYLDVTSKYVKPATIVSTANYNYKILKSNKKSVSATDAYVIKPMTITKMSDGKYYAKMTVKNASWWKSFKTEVNGKMTSVKTISTNKTKNTRTVQFQVVSPKKLVKLTVHIQATKPKYEGTYTNYIQIGKVIPTKKVVQVSNKAKTTKKSFTVYKNKTSKRSVMDQYVQKPATIQKVGSKTYVKMTLKNASWWKSFKVKQGSKYVSAKVVAKGKNTRTVQFPVSNIKKGAYVKVHVKIPSMKYNHHYTTKIVFK